MVKHDTTGGTRARAALALVAVIGSFGATQIALAQAAAGVTIEVGDCVKLQAPEERLACYERQVDAAEKRRATHAGDSPAAASAPQAAPLPAAPATSAATAPSAGRRTANTPGRHAERDPPEDNSAQDKYEQTSTIVAMVAALKQTVPNAYLITLDNGQVWRQNYPQWYPLQPGQRVTLSGTRWGGSYHLRSDELQGFIQVERVR